MLTGRSDCGQRGAAVACRGHEDDAVLVHHLASKLDEPMRRKGRQEGKSCIMQCMHACMHGGAELGGGHGDMAMGIELASRTGFNRASTGLLLSSLLRLG